MKPLFVFVTLTSVAASVLFVIAGNAFSAACFGFCAGVWLTRIDDAR